MYDKIVNPDTGKKVNIGSIEGKTIINKYLNYLEGGAARKNYNSLRTTGERESGTVGNAERIPRRPGPLLSATQRVMQATAPPRNRQRIVETESKETQQRPNPQQIAIESTETKEPSKTQTLRRPNPQQIAIESTETKEPSKTQTLRRPNPQQIAIESTEIQEPSKTQTLRRPNPQQIAIESTRTRTRRPRYRPGSLSPRRTSYNVLQENIAVLGEKIDGVQNTQYEILEKLEENSSGFCSIS